MFIDALSQRHVLTAFHGSIMTYLCPERYHLLVNYRLHCEFSLKSLEPPMQNRKNTLQYMRYILQKNLEVFGHGKTCV